MKQIRIIARILLGLVFIFSGFVKGVDPMGSAIKFSEYFESFHLDWFTNLSLFLAILLSTTEFIIGIALVLGLKMRITSWASILFMTFFTIVTLYSAITNAVPDCGCFGDAIILTNWQTFYKNVVLIIIAFFVFKNRDNYIPFGTCFTEWALILIYAFAIVLVSAYSVKHLPIMDFRPYHVGTNIAEKMELPDTAEKPVYKTTYLYKKGGTIKEFDEKGLNTIINDTAWVWVETKNVLIKEGYKPPIHDFSIVQEDGQDITQQILYDSNYSFIFLSFDLNKISYKNWEVIKHFKNFTDSAGYNFYFVTGSPSHIVSALKSAMKLDFMFAYADVTTLKTINRANPGLMLLKDGTILAQYNVNDLPPAKDLNKNILSKMLTKYYKGSEHQLVLILALLLLLSFSVILIFKPKG